MATGNNSDDIFLSDGESDRISQTSDYDDSDIDNDTNSMAGESNDKETVANAGNLISRKRKNNPAGVIKELFEAVQGFKTDDGKVICDDFKRYPNRMQEPKYRDIVSKPMTISVIQNKFKTDKYNNVESLQEDVKLLVDNAITFYPEDSEKSKNAKMLWEFFSNKKQEVISHTVKKQKVKNFEKDYGIEVPDVINSVKKIMKSLFAKVRTQQSREGRSFFESLTSEYKEVDENKVISLDMIDHRVETGAYKRLDALQDDLFNFLEHVRRISKSDSQLFQDSIELQSFFIRQRDEICQNGAILDSPALNYTLFDLDEAVDIIRERANGNTNSIMNKAENELSAGEDDVRFEENSVFQMKSPQKTKIVANRLPPNSDRSCTYYEQYNAPSCLIKIGDCVFVNTDAENPNDRILCSISRIWENQKGDAFIRGQRLKFPDDIAELSEVMFCKKEVILTNLKANYAVSQIVEKSAVLKYSDYISCRPTEISEKNVFVCKSMVIKAGKHLISLPKYGLRKFVHCSAVSHDEVYFFSRISKLEITKEPNLPREKHECIFTWEELNELKHATIAKEDTAMCYIRTLLYSLFFETTDPKTEIRRIKDDLIKFSALYILRIPKKPVIDIGHMLLRSKHVRLDENELINKIDETKWYWREPLIDYPYKVPKYIIDLRPGKQCGGQPLILNTEAAFDKNAAKQIWRDPPHEPRGAEIVDTSDSDDSVAFKMNQELFYKLEHLGASWQPAFLGNDLFSAENDTSESSVTDLSFRKPSSNASIKKNNRTESMKSDPSQSSRESEIARKACELAKITVIPVTTMNQIKVEGDSLIVDVLIVCLDMDLCRFLSATFGLIHVDQILLDFINQRTEKTKPSLRYKFTDSNIEGRLKIWWNKLMTINRGDHKTFRTLQTRYCEYLSVGCHNIAITQFQEIVPNVTANSYAIIKDRKAAVLQESLYTCIIDYSSDLRFLSGVSALTRILDCILKYKTSIPMKFMYKRKFYEISVSLICVVPFYILRAISSEKYAETISEMMRDSIEKVKELPLV